MKTMLLDPRITSAIPLLNCNSLVVCPLSRDIHLSFLKEEKPPEFLFFCLDVSHITVYYFQTQSISRSELDSRVADTKIKIVLVTAG